MTAITTTYLEMTDAAQLCPRACADARFRILEATEKQWRFNRFLYVFIGSEWAWRDKLSWTDEQWRSYVEDDRLRTFVAYYDGSPAGYFELSEREQEVEIAYFGLAPSFIGRGFGGPLLTRAIEEAWKAGPTRVWVHTCNLDHDAALANYQARGMVVYKTETTLPNKRMQETANSRA
jgi:GNAT superfamily N-acetyltransferase